MDAFKPYVGDFYNAYKILIIVNEQTTVLLIGLN
jgi:hypothetical protein